MEVITDVKYNGKLKFI